MNAYVIVYSCIGLVMAGLVFIIGMPWSSGPRDQDRTSTR